MALDPKTLELVRQKAEALSEAQIAFLRGLVEPDSGTGNVEGNRKVSDLVIAALSRLPGPPRVETVLAPGIGRHVVARIGRSEAGLKFLGMAHLDTVFAPGESAAHPFRLEGDKIFGLGVADCKGGVAVSLFGALAALELGLWPDNVELTLLYTSDEETGSATSRALFEREAEKADYALVFEPGRGQNGLITARKGCALGSVVIGGREAHALSAYPSGVDANLAMARAILSVCGANDPAAGRFFNFGTVTGGKHADIVADSARAEFFVTFGDEAELELVKGVVKGLESKTLVEGAEIATSLEVSFPPLVPTPESLEAYRRIKAVGAALGLDLPEQSSPGSSDGCWVATHGVPVIDALGPYMYDIHTTDEAVRLSSFAERTALFAALIPTLGDWPARRPKA